MWWTFASFVDDTWLAMLHTHLFHTHSACTVQQRLNLSPHEYHKGTRIMSCPFLGGISTLILYILFFLLSCCGFLEFFFSVSVECLTWHVSVCHQRSFLPGFNHRVLDPKVVCMTQQDCDDKEMMDYDLQIKAMTVCSGILSFFFSQLSTYKKKYIKYLYFFSYQKRWSRWRL